MSDFAFIEAGGERIVEWTRYSIDSDLATPADGFEFSVDIPREDEQRRRRLAEVLAPGVEVQVLVGEDVGNGRTRGRYAQMVGVIDDRTINVSREGGTTFSISGRDLAGFLVDSSVDLDLDVSAGMRLVDLVTAAVEPFGITVITDSYGAQRTLSASTSRPNEAARAAGVPASSYSLSAQAEATRMGRPVDEVTGNFLANAIHDIQARRAARSGYANVMGPSDIEPLTVRDARPQVGETVWAFCARHAERLGVLMWFSPLGRLILSSPRYGQEPRHSAIRRWTSDPSQPNNVLAGELSESIGSRFSEVTVFGRGNMRSATRQVVRGVATDDSWPSDRPKPFRTQESDIRTSDAAARKALRELMRAKADAFRLDYTLPDHGANGYLYAIDSTLRVLDEPADVDGIFYIVKRTFTKDRESGTMTRMSAVPRGSLVF